MLRIIKAKIFCCIAIYCLTYVLPCSGQVHIGSPGLETDQVSLRKRFGDIFPNADSSKVQTKNAFDDKKDYRKFMVNSVSDGTPAEEATVLEAYVSSSMGMKYGTSISLDVILCNELVAVQKIENGVLNLVIQRKFSVIQDWDAVGFAAFRSRECSNIFKEEALCEDATLLIKIDKRLSDQYGVISLIYDVKAGPRRRDPSSFAETDRTQSAEVDEYMGSLQRDIKGIAVNALKGTCTRVTSEDEKSEGDAIRDVSNRLKTNSQRDQTKAAVERQKR